MLIVLPEITRLLLMEVVLIDTSKEILPLDVLEKNGKFAKRTKIVPKIVNKEKSEIGYGQENPLSTSGNDFEPSSMDSPSVE